MADAKKCDVCGKLYELQDIVIDEIDRVIKTYDNPHETIYIHDSREHEPRAKPVEKYPVVGVGVLYNVRDKYFSIRYELCSECMAKVANVLNDGLERPRIRVRE